MQPRVWPGVLVAVATVLLSSTSALAATITVDTTADPLTSASETHCSLRYAVAAVDASQPFKGCPAGDGHDTIVLPAGNYALAIPHSGGSSVNDNGDLNVIPHHGGSVLHIEGAGSDSTTIDASAINDRVITLGLDNGLQMDVTISGVTLTGGHAPDGAAGTTEGVNGTVGAPGGDGGAILNRRATLTISDSSLHGNRTGRGGDGGNGDSVDGGNAGPGGASGAGGAVYTQGPLTLTRDVLYANSTNSGGRAGAGCGCNGDSGAGGAIRATAEAPVAVTDSTISANQTNEGLGDGASGGAGGAISTDAPLGVTGSTLSMNRAGGGGGGSAGAGGAGGAISTSSSLDVTRSTLASNVAGRGGNTLGASGGQGGGGGAISTAGPLTVTASSVSSNAAGAGGSGVSGGSGGSGGAIDAFASATLTGSTFSSNKAGVGGQGQQLTGSSGSGGAVALGSAGQAALINDTVVGNSGSASIVGRGATVSLLNLTVASNDAPGIARASGTVTLTNSLLASNEGGNCIGTIADGGHDLSFPATDGSCPSTFSNGDPRLAPFPMSSGGLTKTLAIDAWSAAIDQVPLASCPPTDQQSVPRPQGIACDIGAFELEVPSVTFNSPLDGAHYDKGAIVKASFACADTSGIAPIAACVGSVAFGVPIDTSSPGPRALTVTATDAHGEHAARTVRYTIEPILEQAGSIGATILAESKGGSVRVPVDNPNAVLAEGELSLTTESTLKRILAASSKKKTTTIGHATFAIQPGSRPMVKVSLSKRARAYLVHHTSLKVVATIVLHSGGRAITGRASLSIRPPMHKST
jgi:hypothetical protein